MPFMAASISASTSGSATWSRPDALQHGPEQRDLVVIVVVLGRSRTGEGRQSEDGQKANDHNGYLSFPGLPEGGAAGPRRAGDTHPACSIGAGAKGRLRPLRW